MFHMNSGWFIPLQDNNTNTPPSDDPILTENLIEITTEDGDNIVTE